MQTIGGADDIHSVITNIFFPTHKLYMYQPDAHTPIKYASDNVPSEHLPYALSSDIGTCCRMG